MRIVLMLVVLAGLFAIPSADVSAQGGGPPSFTAELAGVPSEIDRGEVLRGTLRITNLGIHRGVFTVQTYVDSPFGPAVLLGSTKITIPAGETASAPLLLETAGLEPGEYEVRIGVKRKRTTVLVPLRFTVR